MENSQIETEQLSQIELEQLLIDLVKEKPCLYDLSLDDYKNKDVKSNSWRAIGEKLKITGPECETLWKKLRGQFTDYLRKLKMPTGSGRKAVPNFRHSNAMQFYSDKNKRHPRTISNLENSYPMSPETDSTHDFGSDEGDVGNFEHFDLPNLTQESSTSESTVFGPEKSPAAPASKNGKSTNNFYMKRRAGGMDTFETKFMDIYSNKAKMDEHDSFCSSLAPKLRRIHAKLPGRISSLQIKMLQLIADEEALITS